MTKQSGALLNADSTFAVFFILTLPYVQNKGLLHRWNRGGGFFNQGTVPYVYKLFFGPGNRPPPFRLFIRKKLHITSFSGGNLTSRGGKIKKFLSLFPIFENPPVSIKSTAKRGKTFSEKGNIQQEKGTVNRKRKY